MRLLIKVGNLKYKTMPSDCLKCRKNTESIIPRVPKTNNGKTMILPKCAIYGIKKSGFINKTINKWKIK